VVVLSARILGVAACVPLALACAPPAGTSPRAPDADAGVEAHDAVTPTASDACKFASRGDPSVLNFQPEIIHEASQRLSAPPGGLWWLREAIVPPTVTARDEVGGAVALEVVTRPQSEAGGPVASLRVPAHLPPGTRLVLGKHALVVASPLPPLDLDEVGLQYQYRADLGATGFVVRVAPENRGRVFVAGGHVVHPGANFLLGVKVLEWLLLSDAPRLCALEVPPTASALYVPMWRGQEAEPLGLVIRDADDLGNVRVRRLCPPGATTHNCRFQAP
jgi:hypothetical protein